MKGKCSGGEETQSGGSGLVQSLVLEQGYRVSEGFIWFGGHHTRDLSTRRRDGDDQGVSQKKIEMKVATGRSQAALARISSARV